jgi:pullulanase/glycogen debranching enzyme
VYADDTGCGDTVDLCLPYALRLVMDSRRYRGAEGSFHRGIRDGV